MGQITNTTIEDYLLSIIIPVQNNLAHYSRCIDSVLSQNISKEILLIDNGSTDSFLQILQTYQNQYSYIKIITQNYRGQGEAYNIGVDQARGKYILFLDSEDWIIENMLQTICNKAAENDADICMSNIFISLNKEKPNVIPVFSDKTSVDRLWQGGELFVNLVRSQLFMQFGNQNIYKKDFLLKNKIFFPGIIDEFCYWNTHCLLAAKKVWVSTLSFYSYDSNDSVSDVDLTNYLFSFLHSIDHIVSLGRKYSFSKEKDNLKANLYLQVYFLYEQAFRLLSYIKTSEITIPCRHLYSLYRFRSLISPVLFQECLNLFYKARFFWRTYLKYRLSPWFVPVKQNEKKTVILVFNTMWDLPLSVQKTEIPSNCILTTDRQALPYAEAVVFHLPSLQHELYQPIEKREGQKWIAWSKECEKNFPWIDHFPFEFDMTMSYHSGADIITAYYKYDYMKAFSHSNHNKKPTRGICMLISSNFNESGRKEYLKELMQYIEIDSYGKYLNNKKLENDKGESTRSELYQDYKFVISFENAIAPDYVTEKFYEPLLAGAVPVYKGAPNVEDYIPGENCFVDIRNFEDPYDLASFLKKCLADDACYERFHRWRFQPLKSDFKEKALSQKINPFVRLCKQIHALKRGIEK